MKKCLIVVLLVISGCSSVKITKIDGKTPYEDGLRFYRPKPYLLVTVVEKKPVATLIWLPDKSEEYVIRQNVGWGKNEIKAKLENGWNLTEIGQLVDSQVPQTITALGSLINPIDLFVEGGDASASVLFEIVYDREGKISGVRKIGFIQ